MIFLVEVVLQPFFCWLNTFVRMIPSRCSPYGFHMSMIVWKIEWIKVAIIFRKSKDIQYGACSFVFQFDVKLCYPVQFLSLLWSFDIKKSWNQGCLYSLNPFHYLKSTLRSIYTTIYICIMSYSLFIHM